MVRVSAEPLQEQCIAHLLSRVLTVVKVSSGQAKKKPHGKVRLFNPKLAESTEIVSNLLGDIAEVEVSIMLVLDDLNHLFC